MLMSDLFFVGLIFFLGFLVSMPSLVLEECSDCKMPGWDTWYSHWGFVSMCFCVLRAVCHLRMKIGKKGGWQVTQEGWKHCMAPGSTYSPLNGVREGGGHWLQIWEWNWGNGFGGEIPALLACLANGFLRNAERFDLAVRELDKETVW